MLKWVVMLVLCWSSFQAHAQPLKYNVNASNTWYPYYIGDPEAPGIMGELIPRIFTQANIDIEKINLPPNRTNKALDTGELDFDVVSPSWFSHQDLGPNFVHSEAILPIVERIVVLEENKADWQDIEQIYDKRIGTVRGYLYHDDDRFVRADFSSERELIKALHKKRIDAIISGDLPALYWSQQLGLHVELAAVHSDGDLVIRLRKEHAHMLPQINQAIGQLKHNKVVSQVIAKYVDMQNPVFR
ncbi:MULTISPECIES: substrate-binding periplasmic protein [Shewanella]|uniref:substrate-binding periplasmic protein n=1 Tax=Shewanella TaxID=22 RepID=UPI000490D03F|nr:MULTISPECIES: transporter substrate-binding domain-containing protein [Shewanella]QLE85186.1 transporter substrate-binding domain-containing protein [Shewanella sp. Scap07]